MTLPPEPGTHDEDDEHRRAHRRDLEEARRELDALRRDLPFRRALWGYRLYYIGVFSAFGSLLLGCFDDFGSSMLVVPIGLVAGMIGNLYGYLQVRRPLTAYLSNATSQVWHARRDRKSLWQAAMFRDAFMGRLR